MKITNVISSIHLHFSENPTELVKGKLKQNINISKQSKQENKQNKSSKERIISEDDLNKVFSDDEISHLSDDGDLYGDDIDDAVNDKKKEKPDVWEDIYGRKRDKEGNIIKVFLNVNCKFPVDKHHFQRIIL